MPYKSYIYTYTYIYICDHMYIYIYTYTHLQVPYSINKKRHDRFASTGLNPVVLVPSIKTYVKMQEAGIEVAPRQTSRRPTGGPVDYVTLRADNEDDAAADADAR